MSRLPILLVAALQAVLPAQAQQGFAPIAIRPGDLGQRLDAPLAGGGGATLLDILRARYPDLTADGKAMRVNRARSVENAVDTSAPGLVDEAVDLAQGRDPPTYAVLEDGGARYVLILAEGTVLAAEIAPRYRFLDALFVQTDPVSVTASNAFLMARASPALLITNAHFNAGESFAAYSVVGLVNGRLRSVYDGPLLYSFDASAANCEPKRVIQRLERFAVRLVPAGHARLGMTVTEETLCARDGREVPLEPLRTFPIALDWDAKRGAYTGGSPLLDARNRERMNPAE